MTSIPAPKKVRWWQYSFWVELLTFLGVIGPIAFEIYQATRPADGSVAQTVTSSSSRPGIWSLLVGLMFAFLSGMFKIFQAREKDKQVAEQESPKDLLGCTHVLHSVLKAMSSADDLKFNELRVTVHRVFNDAKNEAWFEQVVPYVGGDPGTVGRKLPIECGLVGLTARTNEVNFFQRTSPDHEAYLGELKKNFGFTTAQLRTLRTDRVSCLGIPICDDKRKVIGVVYLDSSKKDIFSKPEVQAIAVMACTAIARCLSERYK